MKVHFMDTGIEVIEKELDGRVEDENVYLHHTRCLVINIIFSLAGLCLRDKWNSCQNEPALNRRECGFIVVYGYVETYSSTNL